MDPVAASVIRDNCEGTQFELPALCIAKWRLRKFLLHNRRRSTLGQAKQNKSPVEQEQGIVVRGGRQTLLALRIMKQRNRRIHLRVWTKNPGWEYGFLGSRNRVKEKFQLPNAKRIRRDERHSLLGIYISALPAATQSCFPSIFFYDYFSFIFH